MMTRMTMQTSGYRSVTKAPNGSKSADGGAKKRKNFSAPPAPPPAATDVASMLESIVGCKWSMSVLAALRAGVHRPGALERACAGISTKVLNERLRKLTRFGVIERTVFPEIPPRVEYHFTPFGKEFLSVIDSVEQLQRRLDQLRGRETSH